MQTIRDYFRHHYPEATEAEINAMVRDYSRAEPMEEEDYEYRDQFFHSC